MKKLFIISAVITLVLLASSCSVQLGHIKPESTYFYPDELPGEFIESAMAGVTVHYVDYEEMFAHNGEHRGWVPCSIDGWDIFIFNGLAPEDEAGCLNHELGHMHDAWMDTGRDGHEGWLMAPYAPSRVIPGTNGSRTYTQSERVKHWEPYGYDSMVMARFSKYLSTNNDCGRDAQPVTMQVRNNQVQFSCTFL